ARAVRSDRTLSESERQRRAEQYASRAVALFGQGIDEGVSFYSDDAQPESLRVLDASKALLEREDFRKLLASLEEVKKFEGTWSIVTAERQGQPEKDLLQVKVTFSGSRFTAHRQGQVLLEGSIRLDPKATPKRILSRMSSGSDKGRTRLGI